MKHFAGYVLTAVLAFAFGGVWHGRKMANDLDYHDYWMKECKKSK